MKALHPDKIKAEELRLLEGETGSLADWVKRQDSHKLFKQPTLKQTPKSLDKLKIKKLKSFGFNSNANFQAFTFLMLWHIYEESNGQDLLSFIKSVLYHQSFNLKRIKHNMTSNLSSNQMKKLIVEFFYSLDYSPYEDKIQIKCQKYPIVLDIFVVFFRCILIDLNVKNANNFLFRVQTNQFITGLVQLLDLNCKISKDLYLFYECEMLMMESQYNESLVGWYSQSYDPISPIPIMEPSKISSFCSLEDDVDYLDQKNFQQYLLNDSVENSKNIDRSICIQQAPTPFFNLHDGQDKKINSYLTPYFQQNIMKVSRQMSLAQVYIPQTKQHSRTISNHIIKEEETANKQAQSYKFLVDSPSSMYSEGDYIHNLFAMREGAKELKKSKSEDGQISSQQIKEGYQSILPKDQSKQSCCTCSCSNIKSNKNKIESNIYQIAMAYMQNSSKPNQSQNDAFIKKQRVIGLMPKIVTPVAYSVAYDDYSQHLNQNSLNLDAQSICYSQFLASKNGNNSKMVRYTAIKPKPYNEEVCSLWNNAQSFIHTSVKPKSTKRQFSPLSNHSSSSFSKQTKIPKIKFGYKNILKSSAHLQNSNHE